MDEFEDQLATAGDALLALAEGPGAAAARALEDAFSQTGARIGDALSQAARSGELDFNRMAEAILRDLARIAADAVFAGGGQGGGPVVNLNLAGSGAQARGLMASQGAISAALARAVSQGGRFL